MEYSTSYMARNASANEDILYKYTIDEIRLRLISDLQENFQDDMNIHKRLSMRKPRLDFTTLDKFDGCRKLVSVNL